MFLKYCRQLVSTLFMHYKMNVGLLKEGDAADFIVVKDLKTFEVLQTYIDGELGCREWKIKNRKCQNRNNKPV